MKKSFALLLILVLTLSLCACGSQNVSGTVTPAEDTHAAPAAEESVEPEPAAEESVEPEAAVEETEEAEPEPAAEEPAPEETEPEQPELGTVSGGRYENAFLGLGCELDESWVFASEEELAEFIGLTADAIGGDYAERMLKADMFYDMFAQSEEELATVNMVIQNVGLAGSLLTEEQHIDTALKTLEDELTPAGFTDIQVEKTSISFLGEDHIGIRIFAQVQGVPIYEQQVCLKKGQHVASLTVATYLTDNTDEILSRFYSLG